MNSSRKAARLGGPAVVGLTLALSVTGLVLSAPGAASKSPRQVDPALMQPALNPDFAPWSCWEAGTGIICQGDFETTFAEPIGLECDGQAVHVSGYGREQMTRWHTADGRATKTRVQLSYPEDVFSLSPTGEGPTLTFAGHWNRHYTYAVPGDPDSRTLTEKGLIYRAKSSDGVVFRDVGSVEFAPGEDFETVTELHGVHDFYATNDGAVFDELICSSLT